jgi:hypothetical protein
VLRSSVQEIPENLPQAGFVHVESAHYLKEGQGILLSEAEIGAKKKGIAGGIEPDRIETTIKGAGFLRKPASGITEQTAPVVDHPQSGTASTGHGEPKDRMNGVEHGEKSRIGSVGDHKIGFVQTERNRDGVDFPTGESELVCIETRSHPAATPAKLVTTCTERHRHTDSVSYYRRKEEGIETIGIT